MDLKTVDEKGSCEKLLELLEYMCRDEPQSGEVYKWVLCWLAYPIQNPGAKMKTALVIHGGQGVGKNLFFEVVMEIYGEHGRVVNQAYIDGKFNDWAMQKLFVIFNEVSADNKLKDIVTNKSIRIHRQCVGAHDEYNQMNMVFLFNEAEPVVSDGDNRFMVIWTPEKRDNAFYRAVVDEIADGGIEALRDYLLHLDLGWFDAFEKPFRSRVEERTSWI